MVLSNPWAVGSHLVLWLCDGQGVSFDWRTGRIEFRTADPRRLEMRRFLGLAIDPAASGFDGD
jgi:hypothetical protein